MKKIICRWRTNKKNSLSRSSTKLEAETGGKHKTTSRIDSNVSSTNFGSYSAFSTSSSNLLSSSSSSSSRADYVSGISSSHDINSSPIVPTLNNGTDHVSTKQNKQNSSVEDRRGKGNHSGSNMALCMLLISLLVLILWGKFVAILCTSIWFYLMPPIGRRRPCNNYEEGGSESEFDEFDSVQYKKKIVMEGLLERSHSRVSLASSSTPSS